MKKLLVIIAALMALLVTQDRPQETKLAPLSAPSSQGIHKLVCGKMSGTGVMVSPHFMTTAAHVVRGANHCTIEYGMRKQTISFEVVRTEPVHDFALLKTSKTISDHRTINCDGISQDETYTIAGYPFGGPSFKVAPALPISLYYNMADGGADHLRAMDSKTHQGMSGGPVIQNDGRVVGFLVGEMLDATNYDVVKEYRDVSLCDPR